jgi:hypothetical protein
MDGDDRDPIYFQKLKSLNQGFKKWVIEYMDKGQYFDFTPVCKDYINHITKLDDKYPILETPVASEPKKSTPLPQPSAPSTVAKATPVPEKKPSFGTGPPSTTTAQSSFLKPVASSTPTMPAFGTSASTGFNFGTGLSNFSTPLAAPTTIVTPAGDDDGENYEPPMVESVAVEEEGAVFSKPDIKFFEKAMGSNKFDMKGKGTVYVKKLDNGKHQLIVRADNALGHLFMNVILTPSIPISVLKNKNVLIIAATENDGIKETVSHLIRLTNDSEAQALADKLNAFKAVG